MTLSADRHCSRRDASKIRHRILKEDEVPNPGTLISIDAEFVALQMVRPVPSSCCIAAEAIPSQEELEIRSDGTKQVLRPSKMSLARVSVLRGDGPNEGEPFIDDYIHTSESIANYLTEFSGIKGEGAGRVRSIHYTDGCIRAQREISTRKCHLTRSCR